MKPSLVSDRTLIARAAEARMKQWLRTQEQALAKETAEETKELLRKPQRAVTISREAGLDGTAVGEEIARRLGWELLDRELLDFMAEKYKVPRDMLDFVDETAANWLYDIFGSWLDQRIVTQEAFVAYLGKIVMLAACDGHKVFVGRGAHYFLDRDTRLAIRIVAPLPFRVAHVMKEQRRSRADAERWILEMDQGRKDFVQRYFHQNVENPHYYDLVLNAESLTRDQIAELTVSAYHLRFG